MLHLERVSTFYSKIQALHKVSLYLEKGEIVSLIGANGAGKSTLLMTLCGTPQAASGSIRYEGEELIGQPTHSIMRKALKVGAYLPASPLKKTLPWAAFSPPSPASSSNWSTYLACSHGWPNASPNAPVPCPAVNNKCSPLAAP